MQTLESSDTMPQSQAVPLLDGQFKDAAPLETVARIRKILENCQIQVNEQWYETSVPYCYALRLHIVGTNFGVNGKGLTREFALASAYGELMERLQLGYIGSRSVQKDGHYESLKVPELTITAEELYKQNPQWYTLLAGKLHHYTGKKESPLQMIEGFADENALVRVTQYYNITRNEPACYPTALQMRVYTSNGCAAGNTPEEAIVQAISEIVERHHQLRLIDEDICAPVIPDAVLMGYPAAYQIICHVRSQGYQVLIKDCSLGMDFPVVGACIIDRKTGKYHTHFGAYPVFEIALERALTESFQGHTIRNIAQFENFVYRRKSANSVGHIVQELVKGTGERSPNFFVGNPDSSPSSLPGLSGTGNRGLLHSCIDYFRKQGLDVLIRDASCLGFPTFQVIVPGYSEIFAYRLSPKLDDHRYGAFASRVLRNPSQSKPNEMMGLLMHLTQMKQFSANISGMHGFAGGAKLALTLSAQENSRLLFGALGYVYYALGKLDEAQKYADKLVGLADDTEQSYLICLKRFLAMKIHRYAPEQIRKTLEFFHGPQVTGKLYGYLDSHINPFIEFTLQCDLSRCQDCPVFSKCCQKQILALRQLINKKTAEMDFADSCATLASLLTA